MIYRYITIYGNQIIENYANLASYFLIHIVRQIKQPTGHELSPIPVIKALNILDIQNIINVRLFANRLIYHSNSYNSLFNYGLVNEYAQKLIERRKEFEQKVLTG